MLLHPATLDPLQFAYRPNRSTDDAISQVTALLPHTYDITNGNYVRLLFIDYSSAFNTIVSLQASCPTLRPRPKHYHSVTGSKTSSPADHKW